MMTKSNNNPHKKTLSDHQDRLIDLALREKLSGQRPPDLSEKILGDRPSCGAATAREKQNGRRAFPFAPFAAAGCVLGLLVIVALLNRPQEIVPVVNVFQGFKTRMGDYPIDRTIISGLEEGTIEHAQSHLLRRAEVTFYDESESMNGERLRYEIGGQTLPSPFYASDDVQYYESAIGADFERNLNDYSNQAGEFQRSIVQSYGGRALENDAIKVELSDFGSETAPRNDLFATIGAVTGRSLEGRGRPVGGRDLLETQGGYRGGEASGRTLGPASTPASGDSEPEPESPEENTEPGRPLVTSVVPIVIDPEGNESKQSGEKAGEAQKGKEEEPKPVKKTWRRASATENAARLVIGDHDEILPQGVQANVVIDGFRARVLLDYYFYNDRANQLEGAFKLRLPDEASLYYFAFGETVHEFHPRVDKLAAKGFLSPELVRAGGVSPEDILALRSDSFDKVKEARMVPREQASYAYSETTRRRIDPALVEWMGAGVFNAKVFPLMPSRLHRVVIGYDVNLQHADDSLRYAFAVPQDVGEVSLEMNVATPPGIEATFPEKSGPLPLKGRTYLHLENPQTPEVAVELAGAGNVLLAGSDNEAGDFFALEFTPELPAGGEGAGSSHAIFLVDTSLSSDADRFNVFLDLLEATLNENRPSLGRFAVLFFNIEQHWWQERFAENTPENVKQLLSDCRALALEGATDLGGAIAEAASPQWDAKKHPAPDLFLLSDGASTWGESIPALIAAPLKSETVGPLFAYRTGIAGTATPMLEYLSRNSGGAVFSIAQEEEIKKAATAHRQRPWLLDNISLAGGSDLLIAGRPTAIYPGQRLLISGRGTPALDAVLNLQLRRGEEQQIAQIKLDRVLETELAPRLYGQIATGQLEALGGDEEEVATAYARHFRITGQTCSLLMLESEEDYLRYNIKPEEDAFVVKTVSADSHIQRAIAAAGEQWKTAKSSLIAWLARMENMPGISFKQSTALKLAVEKLPDAAFEVTPEKLVCQLRGAKQLSAEYAEELKKQAGGKGLDYYAITEEAARRQKTLGSADALKASSSLVEASPGDFVLARDVAYAALENKLPGQAYWLLRRVSLARPYEPQTLLAMAECLAEIDRADLALVYYELATSANWDGRFGEFHRIAAIEYLRLLRRIETGELKSKLADYAAARRAKLSQEMKLDEADLVVVMQWNTDRTDVDLHILEPSGEECYYSEPDTKSGGHITSDVTQGFGPEMYILPKAPHGNYLVKVHFFGADANRTSTRSKVYLKIYENFGTERETVTPYTVLLGQQEETREVATVKVEK